jgi:hypothetical protein
MIFWHNNTSDLKVLTETCKRFEYIIGSRKSLMLSLPVNWNRQTYKRREVHVLTESIRRYRTLNIRHFRPIALNSNLDKFVTKKFSSLSDISIHSCAFKISELLKMLDMVAMNLKSFKLQNTKVENDLEPYAIRFAKLSDLSLIKKFGNQKWIPILTLFEACTTIEVSKIATFL